MKRTCLNCEYSQYMSPYDVNKNKSTDSLYCRYSKIENNKENNFEVTEYSVCDKHTNIDFETIKFKKENNYRKADD